MVISTLICHNMPVCVHSREQSTTGLTNHVSQSRNHWYKQNLSQLFNSLNRLETSGGLGPLASYSAGACLD